MAKRFQLVQTIDGYTDYDTVLGTTEDDIGIFQHEPYRRLTVVNDSKPYAYVIDRDYHETKLTIDEANKLLLEEEIDVIHEY